MWCALTALLLALPVIVRAADPDPYSILLQPVPEKLVVLTLPEMTTRITKAWMLADTKKEPLTVIMADNGLPTIVVPEFPPADCGDAPVVIVAELKGGPISIITDFVFPGLPAATTSGNEILVNVPLATDLTKLTPIYQTGSPEVTGKPASGTTLDFTLGEGPDGHVLMDNVALHYCK